MARGEDRKAEVVSAHRIVQSFVDALHSGEDVTALAKIDQNILGLLQPCPQDTDSITAGLIPMNPHAPTKLEMFRIGAARERMREARSADVPVASVVADRILTEHHVEGMKREHDRVSDVLRNTLEQGPSLPAGQP